MVPRDDASVLAELSARLDEAARRLVPWFHTQMPEAYFENTDAATRLEHLAAIVAARAAGHEPRLRLRSSDGRRVTFVLPEDLPGTLSRMVQELGDPILRAAKIYSALDGQLVIDSFEIGESPPCDPNEPAARQKIRRAAELAAEAGATLANGEPISEAALAAHVAEVSQDYVRDCWPERIVQHVALADRVRRTGGAEVTIQEAPEGRARVVVAVSRASGKDMLLRVADRLGTQKINIVRAYVDLLRGTNDDPVVIVSAVVTGPDGGRIDAASPLGLELRRDLARLKWLGGQMITLAYRVPELGLRGAEVLAAYAELTTRLLLREGRTAFGRDAVRATVEQELGLSLALASFFLERFDPDRAQSQERARAEEERMRRLVAERSPDAATARIFDTLLDAILATKRTNFFVEGRYALSLRLAPELLGRAFPGKELPFGVYFVHGRGMNAFHIRFRDTARGGVRVVATHTNEQHLRETERHLDEVWGLAFAQQLKNKDIPEGGAKAVVLVSPGHDVTESVRAFTEAMLDLLVTDRATRGRVVDLLGHEERLYFGPDENIVPAHIEWIVARAKARGYPTPNAIMSSKPGAGINHKEFGVTSEGVAVFLEVFLRSIGIDPYKDPFTLKLTGGPDGDVGGNMIKIAVRDWAAQVRIVGIADGGGSAEDPAGLDQGELLRLVHASLSIAAFDPSKLSPLGRVTKLSDPDGPRIRNELVGRVVADAFVPAGGRPETLNGSNWATFFLPDGSPSSRLVVEGANLFLTSDARQKLFERGVCVVKDSSANKCGVICSSYEVLASLLLSEAELIAIKPTFVAEVIERLRLVARLEAEQLIEAQRAHPTVPLFELSVALSREINRLTDAVLSVMPRLEAEDPDIISAVLLSYIPASLLEAAGARLGTLPPSYRAAVVATALASRLVYREGIDFLAGRPEADLGAIVLAYVRRERKNRALVAEIEGSELPHAREIANLLRKGGTRSGLFSA
jgi:glutamate dehydrogenase